jgi:hypothetical protein
MWDADSRRAQTTKPLIILHKVSTIRRGKTMRGLKHLAHEEKDYFGAKSSAADSEWGMLLAIVLGVLLFVRFTTSAGPGGFL